MISDFCMDLLNSTGELKFAAMRCVQCGEVVDPVIQRNRQLRQAPITVGQLERGMVPGIMCKRTSHRGKGDAMRARALTYGLTIIVAASMGGCIADGSRTDLSSGQAVKPVTAREAVDRDFGYRQQAAVLRDRARSLELEAQVAMEWADSKEDATLAVRKARAMRMAADTAERTAQEYRRHVPHNQVN